MANLSASAVKQRTNSLRTAASAQADVVSEVASSISPPPLRCEVCAGIVTFDSAAIHLTSGVEVVESNSESAWRMWDRAVASFDLPVPRDLSVLTESNP